MNPTLDSQAAAEMLHIHEQTLEKMARNGEIPACKPGKAWVYLTDELLEWLREQSRKNLKPTTTGRRKKTPELSGL